MEEAATRPHHPVREEGDEEGEDVLLLLPALELDGAVLHGVELEAGVARDALLPAHHPLLLTVHGADPHHALQHHSQPAVRSKYFIIHNPHANRGMCYRLQMGARSWQWLHLGE